MFFPPVIPTVLFDNFIVILGIKLCKYLTVFLFIQECFGDSCTFVFFMYFEINLLCVKKED